MATLTIRCDKCGGNCWEDITSSKYQDIVCIYCGRRKFIPIQKYKQFKAKIDRLYRDRLKIAEAKHLLAPSK